MIRRLVGRPLLVLLAATSPALAQHMPRVLGTAQLGRDWTSGGEFRVSDGVLFELAGSIRFPLTASTAIDATAAFSEMGYVGDITTICIPSRHGGCRPGGADVAGWSVLAGIEHQFFPALAVGAAIGAGWQANQHNGPPGGAHAFPIRAHLAVPLIPHLDAVGTVQHIVFRDFGGENFQANAVLFGLRIR